MKRKKNTPPPSIQEITHLALEEHRRLLPVQEFDLLIKELEKPLYPALRVNPLKCSPASPADWAQFYDWELQPVPYCPTGWWITKADHPVSQAIEHRLGLFYLQDAASMLPVQLFDLDPDPNLLVLDMAASPGGKTTHLISRTDDSSLIVANDSSAGRITALRLVLQTWGATSTAVTSFPGEKFGGWFPETFDRILLDAPCSMQNLRSTESHPMRPITASERKSLSTRQTRLLTSGFQALKPGGQIVYATCTLAPEEDEAVLDNLVSLFGSAAKIETLDGKLPAPAPGLAGDGARFYHPDVVKAARLYPHRFGTSGFFCALISKQSSIVRQTGQAPQRDLSRTSLIHLSDHEAQPILNQVLDVYGFDFQQYLAHKNLALWQRHTQVYIIPEQWITHFGDLPFQAVGMLFGDVSEEGFIPSHEWITRFAIRFDHGKIVLEEDQVDSWLKGEDIQMGSLTAGLSSDIAVVYDRHQRLLGRGKIVSGRIKNLLPRRVIY